MQTYVGSVLAIVLGLVVDLTAGTFGLRWWYLVGIGVVTVVVAVLLWPRKRPAPTPGHSLIGGAMSDSSITRARVRGADHLVDGSVTRSHFCNIKFE